MADTVVIVPVTVSFPTPTTECSGPAENRRVPVLDITSKRLPVISMDCGPEKGNTVEMYYFSDPLDIQLCI